MMRSVMSSDRDLRMLPPGVQVARLLCQCVVTLPEDLHSIHCVSKSALGFVFSHFGLRPLHPDQIKIKD